MFGKSLRYYRLKNNFSKRQLAAMVHVTLMSTTHYEQGTRMPSMEIIEALAEALHVRVSDFLAIPNENLVFAHGPFPKGCKLTKRQKDYLCAAVEEYMSRFYLIVEILGGDVLPPAPACHVLSLSHIGDAEEDAKALRRYLHMREDGPVGHLIEHLENMGVLVCLLDLENTAFSGMHGLVNGRPYIALKDNAPPEYLHSAIARELSLLSFAWPDSLPEQVREERANAIAGAFLFPQEDVQRQLGMGQPAVPPEDRERICREYGISMSLLRLRSAQCGIALDRVPEDWDYSRSAEYRGNQREAIRMPREEPLLFSQLVYRAVREQEISIQKGAELLQQSYSEVSSHCFGG